MTTKQDYITFLEVNSVLNSISLLCGLIVIGLIITIRSIDSKLVDRISIRFTFVISLVDSLRSISFLIYAKTRSPGMICNLVSFTNQWLTLLYLFLTASIAVNLQVIFLMGNTSSRSREILYWILPVLMSILLPTIPWASGKLGYDEITQTCDYKDPTTSSAWLWFTFLGWILLVCGYCTIIVGLTIIKLDDKRGILDKLLIMNDGHYRRRNLSHRKINRMIDDIRRLIRRISLYCLIPIITQFGHVTLRIYEHYHPQPNLNFYYFAMITTDLPGLLNLIAFLLDPAFTNTLRQLLQLKLPTPSLTITDRKLIQFDTFSSNSNPCEETIRHHRSTYHSNLSPSITTGDTRFSLPSSYLTSATVATPPPPSPPPLTPHHHQILNLVDNDQDPFQWDPPTTSSSDRRRPSIVTPSSTPTSPPSHSDHPYPIPHQLNLTVIERGNFNSVTEDNELLFDRFVQHL